MYDDVLIPVDRGEESNLTAIDEVLDFIHRSENGVIRLLYVWTSEREQDASVTRDTEHPHPIKHAKNYIENSPVTVDITSETRIGNPAEEISAHADTKNVNTIVMATYGRSGVKRVLLGSTTESVIKQSTPPVLVVNRE